MRYVGIWLLILAALSAPATAGAPATQPVTGSVRGKVSIEGETDAGAETLSRAVVYLASHPSLDDAPDSLRPAEVQQIDKTFKPDFLVVIRGTVVEFPNWDTIAHNVFSRSAAAPAFDLDRYPYGQSKSRRFEKLGVVQVFCNIHPKMRAVIFVTPNRHFVRAGGDGAFELKGVPPGRYELVVWHERCEESRQPIEVTAEATPELTIALKSSSRQALINGGQRRAEAYGVGRGLSVKRERLGLPVVKESHPAPPPAKADGHEDHH